MSFKRFFTTAMATALVLAATPVSTFAQMRTEKNDTVIKNVVIDADVVVAGGGLSGVCAAVAAARHGAKVVLVQDRPVLGGNASSEMRMGICGAFGDQNQETGILEEIQMLNSRHNPLQRFTVWDDMIYTTVVGEKNITLLLNTSVNDVVMKGKKIAAVKAWNTNAYKNYTINGKIFVDCTGDGILRLSGAEYRIGREAQGEFGEAYTVEGEDSHTMGNSILLQLRKTDEHHPFVAPEWAYTFTDEDFNYDRPKSTVPGVKFNYKKAYPENNNFWWIEFGGLFDTIGDANDIHTELKKIAYGVWAYMKNHPDGRCKNYELDWIGAIPGKRESTRFMGPHVLTQNDVLSGGHFPDNIAYGGWTLDNHDPEAFHKRGRISVEYSAPDLFGIPFGCLYSRNVPNLMFAGRDISATHMAMSASRVMATCAMLGQAAGTGAALAVEKNVMPDDVRNKYIADLQARLEDDDCMLPFRWRTPSQLTLSAKVSEENEVLRNGIDRKWNGEDNGVWVAPGEEKIEYTWKKPVDLSGARIIFDSDLKWRSKRMRKLEATTERIEMPKMMARGFKVQALVDKQWVTVYEDDDNCLRLRKVTFAPVKTKGLRLVVDSTWGGDKAHIFAFDAL